MILAHLAEVIQTAEPNSYVGSLMYEVIAEHEAAVLLVTLMVAAVWFLRRRAAKGSTWASEWVAGYRHLTVAHRFLAWLLAISAAVHAGLVLGHEPAGSSVIYGSGAVAFTWVLFRLVQGRIWKRWTVLLLMGSIVAYAISTFSGEPSDQVGMATKLVELTALAIAVAPAPERRLRGVLANSAVIALFFVVALGSWVGAFSGDGGHHLGVVPTPGVLVPVGEDRAPTAAETLAANNLHQAVVAALDKYQDPAVAAADGYEVDDMWGMEFHAANPGYEADDHILDPEKPENLVYAVVGDKTVLLGALFAMPEMNQPGPAVGGPLTVWHAHDHICLGLPGILTGLQSPFGTCPIGSITIPQTGEMFHVWTVPGAPEPFGDLDDDWLADYLAADV